MRVNFTKVLSALNAENTVIDKKLEDCQDGISRLSKLALSEYGLQGKAYTAVEDTIHSRAPFLRAQWNAWEALRNGNLSHLAAISRLRGQGMHDEIDTDKLLARLWECYRQIAKCRDSQDALMTPKPEVKADSSIRLSQLTGGSLTLLEPLKTGLQKQLDLFYQYQQAAASFYAEAEAKISLLKAANADAALLLSGGAPQMEWVDDVERDYAMHHTEDIKKFMAPAQYKALMAALGRKKDGSINLESLDPKKLYSNGKLNEDLWKALYALPKAYVTDGMAAAGVRAIEEMALGTYNNDNPDYKSIQTVLKWAFPSDGKTIYTLPSNAAKDPGTTEDKEIGYGHTKSDFLFRMIQASDNLIHNTDMPNLATLHWKEATWPIRVAVGQILRIADSIRPTVVEGKTSIWSSSKNNDGGVVFDVAIFGPNSHYSVKESADQRNASVRIIAMQSNIYDYDKFKGGTISWHGSSITGSLPDVARTLENIQNGKDLEKYSFWSSLGEHVITETASTAVNYFFARTGLSIAKSLLIGVLHDFIEGKQKEQVARVLKKVGRLDDDSHQNPALNDEGAIAFNYNSSSSSAGAQVLDEHTDFKLITYFASKKHEVALRKAISTFNNSLSGYCKPSEKPFSYERFMESMADPLNLDGHSQDFLNWCLEKPDLVYRVDCFDPLDGKYHKAGEAVALNSSIQPSNYSYAVSAYTLYELKSDFGVGR